MSALPQVGDYQGYRNQGAALYGQAQLAAGGDSNAAASLLQDGITVASSVAGGSPVARTLLTLGGSIVAGFAVGGPVGAAAGLVGGLASAIAQAGDGGAPTNVPLTDADKAIRMRIKNWASTYFAADPTGDPQGWALYDYISQVYPPSTSSSRPIGECSNKGAGFSWPFCTPYVWNADPSSFGGCNLQTGNFGGPPPPEATLWARLLAAILPSTELSVADIADRAVQRRLDPKYYDSSLTLHIFYSGGLSNNQIAVVDASGFLMCGQSLNDWGGWQLLQTLSTVFGMLQVGAATKAIVSELLIQAHIYDLYGPDYEKNNNVFNSILDFYVQMAHAEEASSPQPLDLSALVHAMRVVSTAPVATQSKTASVATGTAVVAGAVLGGSALYAYLTKQAYGKMWGKIWDETGGKLLKKL